jgi:hypothetical protein
MYDFLPHGPRGQATHERSLSTIIARPFKRRSLHCLVHDIFETLGGLASDAGHHGRARVIQLKTRPSPARTAAQAAERPKGLYIITFKRVDPRSLWL